MRIGSGRSLTSSHSAPAVTSAITVSGIPVQRATMAVWSTNLSAPNSSRNKVLIKAATLYAMALPLTMALVEY